MNTSGCNNFVVQILGSAPFVFTAALSSLSRRYLAGNGSAPAFTQGAELVPWLLERDGEDTLVREALAIRVGALVSFWLSDEYAALAR